MMVTNCSICNTEYGLLPGISFHRLPKVESRRERWITAINKRIKNFTPVANVFICSQHFSDDCFLPSPTGKRYLVPNAVPSIFDMQLRKKYKIEFKDQQQLSIEGHDAIAGNKELGGLEIATNIDQSTDNLHKPCVSILKMQHLTKPEIINSTNLDKSANDKARKDEEQLHIEKHDVIANTDHEKLNSETATNIDENQDNLDQPCTSSFKQQHLTKLDILHRNIKIKLSDNNEAKELMRANAYIKKLTKKLNASQQKYKRLQEQATSLAFLVRQLQGEKNTAESLEEDCSDV